MSEALRLRVRDTQTVGAPPMQAAQAYGQAQTHALPGAHLAAHPRRRGGKGRAASALAAGVVANSALWGAALLLLLGGVVAGASLGGGPQPMPAMPVPVATLRPVPPAPQAAALPKPDHAMPQVTMRAEPVDDARVTLAPPPPPVAPPTDLPQAAPPAEDVPAPVVAPQASASSQVATLPVPPVSSAVPQQVRPQPGRAPQPAVMPAPGPVPVPLTGTERWRQLAVPMPAGAKAPFVAIVIDDMGLDRRNSARAAAMAGPLTLSFMAYAPDLAEQAAAARRAGHELMLHMPMEPIDARRNNPGPNALLVAQDEAEWRRRLAWSLDRFDGYVGVNNHMGSRFTQDPRGMSVVMSELQKRGVFWLDSHTGPRSAGPGQAANFGMAFSGRDVFLDDERDAGGVAGQLAVLERIAQANGDAIAIGHPHSATLDALARWMATAQQRGFSLVPISSIVQRRMEHRRS